MTFTLDTEQRNKLAKLNGMKLAQLRRAKPEDLNIKGRYQLYTPIFSTWNTLIPGMEPTFAPIFEGTVYVENMSDYQRETAKQYISDGLAFINKEAQLTGAELDAKRYAEAAK